MHVGGDFTRQELEARARTTESILEEVRTEHQRRPLGLFLSYFYNSHFDPAGFDELRRFRIPSINFYCNSIYQFELVNAVAPKADFAWHPERDARQHYLNAGANPIRVQMGADPDVYHPIRSVARKRAACFVGQRYADRDRWLATLVDAGLPLEIYGPGWALTDKDPRAESSESQEYLGRRQFVAGSLSSYAHAARGLLKNKGVLSGACRLLDQWRYRRLTRNLSPLFVPHARGPISFEKISEVFATYDVCLNFSNVWTDGRPGSELVGHVRLRDFEAPMCRTCYLTGETDEIHEFYDVGKEIDTYSTVQELVDKTRFYLRNESAADQLRDGTYRRALADHTWKARFTQLFMKIDLPCYA
jgi:spore maturation protein CgeB